jgi:hypothetical protein
MDLKEGMKSFCRIQIAKHAKSLELLTEAYKYMHSIDEDGDLEVCYEYGLICFFQASVVYFAVWDLYFHQFPTCDLDSRIVYFRH